MSSPHAAAPGLGAGAGLPDAPPAADIAPAVECDACRRESLRLEANKAFAASLLQMSDNPVLGVREYARFARDLNTAINLHNALCKRYPVTRLTL
jgi:hypothetical protein